MPEETAVQEEPTISNPVLDDSFVKQASAKFRELMGHNEPDKNDGPDPLKQAKQPEPKAPEAKVPEDKPAEKPTELEPTRDRLPDPDANPRRAEFRKLEQSRDDYRKQWEAEKAARAEEAARLKKVEEDLASWRKTLPADPADILKQLTGIESLTKEKEELVKTIETINLERSPRFQRWWNEETSKHLTIAQRHVAPEHKAEIAKLMLEQPSAERDAKLEAITEGLSGIAKRMVYGAIENLESVKLQREDALTRGSEQYKKLQETERLEELQRTKAQEARISGLTKKALESARQFDAFKPTDDAAHNDAIKEREAFVAAAVHGKLDEDLMVMLPAAAAESLYLKKSVIPNLKAELEKRDKLIKELQAAEPRAGSGTGSKPKGDSVPAEPGGLFAARVKELMSQ